MNSNPSKEDIIGWSLSDACSRNERHIVVNTHQPFDAQVWSCQEVNCKGQVSDQMRNRHLTIRVSPSGLTNY
jgi:hypothetical protein